MDARTITLLYPYSPPMKRLQRIVGTVNRYRAFGRPPGSWLVTGLRGERERHGWVVEVKVTPRSIPLSKRPWIDFEIYERTPFAILGA